jgi:hypothetical protein
MNQGVGRCLFSYNRFIDSNRNKQLIDSVGFKSIWRHLRVQLSRAQQVSFSLLPRVALTLQFCKTSDCCCLLCRIVCPSQIVSSTANTSPQISEADKTRLEMQDWLQMSAIQSSAVIGKNASATAERVFSFACLK